MSTNPDSGASGARITGMVGVPDHPSATGMVGVPDHPSATGMVGVPDHPSATGISALSDGPYRRSTPGVSRTPRHFGIAGSPGSAGVGSPVGIPGIVGAGGIPGVSGRTGIFGLTGVPGLTGAPGWMRTPGIPAASGAPGVAKVPGARTILLIPHHLNAVSQPGSRAWETALAMMLGICALALRRSRLPSLPSMPGVVRADAFAVAWTSVRLRRPTVPDAVWAVLGGIAAACLIGGPMAVPAALFGAIGTLVALARRRAKVGVRRKTRVCAQVPPLADLFAAALAAGLQPADAALTVAQAFSTENLFGLPDQAGRREVPTRQTISLGRDSPNQNSATRTSPGGRSRDALSDIDLLAWRFHDAATALLAGTDARAAWSALAQDETTAPLAAAVIRAGRTGAPAAAAVGKAARELREAASAALLAEVHTVGVRATAPLAVCFLPAFVLLGILPTALGLLSRVHA